MGVQNPQTGRLSRSRLDFYYAYDATDELEWKGPNQNGSGSSAFTYDSLGQLLTSQPTLPGLGTLHPTTYAYDPAGHLTSISADGVTTSFLIDALGRHASQTIGAGATTSYAYLGTADTISSASQSGTVAYSGIDAIGDRLTSGTSSAFGYLLADLHGNVVAVMTAGSNPSYSSAYRYDAYGETCDSYSSGSGAITSPWRFGGRILESASGSTDLYDFVARSLRPIVGRLHILRLGGGLRSEPAHPQPLPLCRRQPGHAGGSRWPRRPRADELSSPLSPRLCRVVLGMCTRRIEATGNAWTSSV